MTDTLRQRRPRWQRFLLLLVLILILVAVNALYTPAESWRGVLAAEPGDLLYAAGFDGFSEEWVQDPGRDSQTMIDGTMRLSLGTINTIFSQATPHFEDFDMRVTAATVEGPEDNGYGVIFRLQSDERSCTVGILFCDLSRVGLLRVVRSLIETQVVEDTAPGYYMFLISADGYYSLWRGGDTDTTKRISTWIPSDLVQTGLDSDNQIRVVGRGNQFQFFINGQNVALCIPDNPDAESTYVAGTCSDGTMQTVWEDDNFAIGQIGMVAMATITGGEGVVVEFDNLTITQPDDGSDMEVDRT
ncbi:MAG: hypothetical protein ACPG7F_01510 [Aggregatilineales bacterium]